VVIGRRPTRSSISLTFSVEKAPAAIGRPGQRVTREPNQRKKRALGPYRRFVSITQRVPITVVVALLRCR
jgi:hypothetical protein